MGVEGKRKWQEHLRARGRNKKDRVSVASLGQNEPILVWFASWREIPQGVDHPFRRR